MKRGLDGAAETDVASGAAETATEATKKPRGSTSAAPVAKRPRLDRSSLKKHATLFNRGEERQGFVVTCAVHRENHALAQVLQLLQHYARKFYPDEVERFNQLALTKDEAEEAKSELQQPDATAQSEGLKATSSSPSAEESCVPPPAGTDDDEGTKAKTGPPPSHKPRTPKLFNIFDSGGISGLFFVSVNTPIISPVDFARRIFTDPDFPRQAGHSDACHRLVPIERVCAASEGDIVSTAQALIPAHFPQETETPSKFGIIFDKRNNDRVEKMPVVSQLAALVPPIHTVNLSTPDKVILVYIFKSACGLSITPDYHAFAKYNLHSTAAKRKGANTSTSKEEKGSTSSSSS